MFKLNFKPNFMKKYIFTFAFLTIIFAGFSQKRDINTVTDSKVNFKTENSFNYSLLSQDKVQGVSKGWKFVPLLPFLGQFDAVAGLVQKQSEKSVAVEDALMKSKGASFLVDLEYEKTYTSILWVLWLEKTTVTGYPARIDK